MGTIMFHCPLTQKVVSTGIKADRSTFEASPVFFAATHCPHCRETHRWFAREAWVEEHPEDARAA